MLSLEFIQNLHPTSDLLKGTKGDYKKSFSANLSHEITSCKKCGY